MIGVLVCPNCSLPSIRPLGENTQEEWQACPSCGTVMNLKEERMDKIEKSWIESLKEMN